MRETCRELAETFKDDPNILCWGIGNEIELSGANNGVVWGFVEELAAMMKSIDKRHLVATVIAHNKSALDSIARYAPSLDIVGINSYGSIMQVKDMVAESDYKGPYMITEWGPTGWGETSSTEWKDPIEQTSRSVSFMRSVIIMQYWVTSAALAPLFSFGDRRRSVRQLGLVCL